MLLPTRLTRLFRTRAFYFHTIKPPGHRFIARNIHNQYRSLQSTMSTNRQQVTPGTSASESHEQLPMQQPHQLRDMTIKPTQKEQEIFDLLLQVGTHLQQTQPDLSPVTLRVAGGWVRDKLLGRESHDIDLALDTMMGYRFATFVADYLTLHNIPTKVAKISVNPDKSKHLETATCKVLGVEIDFVNLRTEVYGDDSRVPEVKFGTPEEDALRRDITINALFYNLHTRQVEDFTKLGLHDLQHGITRTPLPPLQTFLDDPLRILRVARFASRFGYTVHQDIWEACKNPIVRKMFMEKISRERVGEEINKMLKEDGDKPMHAVELIVRLRVFDVVFCVPENAFILTREADKDNHQENDNHDEKDKDNVKLQPPQEVFTEQRIDTASKQGITATTLLNSLLHHPNFHSLIPPQTTLTNEDTKLLYLASTLLHYWEYACTATKPKPKSLPKQERLLKRIIKESLKLSSAEGEIVSKGVEITLPIMSIVDIASRVQGHQTFEMLGRKELGVQVMEWSGKPSLWSAKILAEKWFLGVVLCVIRECVERGRTIDEVLPHYTSFLNYTHSLNIYTSYTIRPLLDGREICTLLNLRPGPQVGKLQSRLIEWQLEHPELGVEDAKEEIRSWDVVPEPDPKKRKMTKSK